MDVLQSAAEAAAQLDEQLVKRGKSLSWASPTTKELVITTWNVWFDPFARFTRWAALLEEVMMLAPDVACLQEVVPEFLAVLKASVFVAEHYITSDAGLVAAGFQPCASAGQRRYDVLILVKRGVPVVGWWEVGFPSLMYRRCIGVSIEVATAATAAAGKKPAAGSGAAALQVPGSAALKYGGCTPPVTPEIARKSSKSPKKKAAGAGAGAAAATAATTTIVQIATVHLESSKGGAKYRAKQLDRLAEELGRDSAGNIQSNTTTVVCGDMNLCSSWKDENERIAVGYTDCWPTVHETLGNVELARAGYTEDSSVNTMRYQVKLEHKKVRFDRILIKHWGGGAAATAAHAPAKRFSCKQHGPLCGSASCKESTAAAAAAALAKAPPKPKPVKPAGCWQPQSIHILGTKELCSAAAALAGGYQRSRKKELSVFPSDHFGLATALQFNPD